MKGINFTLRNHNREVEIQLDEPIRREWEHILMKSFDFMNEPSSPEELKEMNTISKAFSNFANENIDPQLDEVFEIKKEPTRTGEPPSKIIEAKANEVATTLPSTETGLVTTEQIEQLSGQLKTGVGLGDFRAQYLCEKCKHKGARYVKNHYRTIYCHNCNHMMYTKFAVPESTYTNYIPNELGFHFVSKNIELESEKTNH